MCFFGGSTKTPEVKPVQTPKKEVAKNPQQQADNVKEDTLAKRIAAAKRNNTVLTSPFGVPEEATTGTKTLLGGVA